jgi:hypothetical protein
MARGIDSFTANGLRGDAAYFWRVNSRTPEGWGTSATGVFVPCGNPRILWGPVSCLNRSAAAVEFRWAPMSSLSTAQWLDVSTDPNFPPGFRSFGPLSVSENKYRWSGAQSNVTYYFRVNALGSGDRWHTSETQSFYAPCAPEFRPDLYGSDDRFLIPRLKVNAPVNVRDVDWTGTLDNPVGAIDVVRYNFPLWDGYGGYPGTGGTTFIAGHVDYYSYGLAVFAPLRDIAMGDVIEYRRGDGSVVKFAVDWYDDLPPDYNWASLAASSTPEAIVLITCNGVFDFGRREYSHRRVVHAVRMA